MTGHRDPAMLGSTGVGAVSSLGSPARNAHASAGTSVQVLVVDDVSDTRFVLRSLLEPLGYEVVEASCGADAIDVCRDGLVDLVLLDLAMPGLDGNGVLAVLKRDSALSDIPVIVLTADDTADRRVKVLELGAHDHITKPFDTQEVQARVGAA